MSGFFEILYLNDVAGTDCITQHLAVQLATESLDSDLGCGDLALIEDGVGALALIPGLDAFRFLALPHWIQVLLAT